MNKNNTRSTLGQCSPEKQNHPDARVSLMYPWCSCPAVSDSATPWTAAHQAPLSMGFFRRESWSGCHALLQGLPDPEVEPCVSCVSCIAGRFFTTDPSGKPYVYVCMLYRGGEGKRSWVY